MKCPYCEKEIPGITCQQCRSVSPEEAKFCMECGVSLVEEVEDTFEDDNGFDLSSGIYVSYLKHGEKIVFHRMMNIK